VTREEYNVLKEHNSRLIAIEDTLRDLPNQIADRMEVKVASALTSCREQHEEDEAHLDELWAHHQKNQGAQGFVQQASGRVSFIVGTIASTLAIVLAIVALTT
jgi:hypothetical protein